MSDLDDLRVACMNAFLELGKVDYLVSMKQRELRELEEKRDTLRGKILALNLEAAEARASEGPKP